MKFASKIFLMALWLLALTVTAARADLVEFETQAVGTLRGAPVGDTPGDYLFSEDGADVHIQNFWSGGSPYFNFCRVEPSIGSPAYFHNGNIMNLNNVGLLFIFSGSGDAGFEFCDFGGSINLRVNGGAVMQANDIGDLAGVVAPGVTMTVSTTSFGSGHKGTAILTGPVTSLQIGGQEFYLDEVRGGDNNPQPGDCDFEVTHETLAYGQGWGSSYGDSPGDFMFLEDGIPVFAEFFHWPSGGTFGNCRIEPTPVPVFGFDRVMQLNNINNMYDISALGIPVAAVTFEYLDYGGFENLEVNGATLFVDDIPNMPVNVAPGVTMSVTTWPAGGGERAYVVLSGNVQKLLVGGQEFYLDNICVIEGEEPGPDPCELWVNNESQSLGAVWGSPYGQSPGDIIFNEDGIDVGLFRFDYGSGYAFGEASISSPVCGVLDSHAMWLNNITAGFILDAVQPVNYARFDYCDCGGMENLRINGIAWVGEFEDIPAGYFGADFTVTVTIHGSGGGCESGTVVIEGPLDFVGVGGQELQIDNFCVGRSDLSSAGQELPTAGISVDSNFPNPFNPSTTIAYSTSRDGVVELAVYDLAGHRVVTLVDGFVPSGSHEVFWNGRDQRGRAAATGMYFVQLRDDTQVVSRKITLVK